ncbi:MAG TPA: hypothetical protein PKV27_13475 [Ilumatobacteraceae bacterium]|nr:hypothetical protein [Ilumatobacteraceae bacterium]
MEAEVERLRRLVGPSELSYRELGDDLAAASAKIRDLEHEIGRLRGERQEIDVQLFRARQDQQRYQTWLSRARRAEILPRRVLGKIRGALTRR